MSGWRVWCVAIVFFALIGIVRAEDPKPPTTAPTLANIPYKSGEALSDYEKERCTLDLYLPMTKKDFPTIVWFYGGGLNSGEKKSGAKYGPSFAEHGIAFVAPNYRLSPKATYPAYLDDAAASVAWVKKHIAEHGGDPNKVFVSGHSAGGYLAAAIGMDPKYLQPYGLTTNDLAGLLPVAPQVFTHFQIREERGVKNAQTTPVIDEAAPAYHVRPDAPAMLLIFGDKDWPARAEEIRYFIAMLKLVKHPDAECMEIADRNHGTVMGKIADPNDPARRAIVRFIESHPTPRPAATGPATVPTTPP